MFEIQYYLDIFILYIDNIELVRRIYSYSNWIKYDKEYKIYSIKPFRLIDEVNSFDLSSRLAILYVLEIADDNYMKKYKSTMKSAS